MLLMLQATRSSRTQVKDGALAEWHLGYAHATRGGRMQMKRGEPWYIRGTDGDTIRQAHQ